MGKIWFVVDPHFYHLTPESRIDDFPAAMLAKLERVVDLVGPADILVLSGDVFYRPHVADWLLIRIAAILAPLRGRVYSIYGNHDIAESSVLRKEDCALSVLAETGVIQILRELDFGPVRLYGFDFDAPFYPPHGDKPAVWVVHKFVDLETTLLLDETLTEEEIARYRPNIILAGHDHTTQEVRQVAGAWVVRPGALSRGTKHRYNLVRDVFVGMVDLDGSGAIDYVQIPAARPDEVFRSQTPTTQRIIGEISDFVAFLREREQPGKENLSDAVAALELEPDVRDMLMRYLYQGGIILKRHPDLKF